MTRLAVDRIVLEDHAEKMMEEARNSMMRQPVSMDAIIAEAHSRRAQQTSSTQETGIVLDTPAWSPITDAGGRRGRGTAENSTGVPEQNETTLSSPPGSPVNQPRGHRRGLSEAESLAESLKENESESYAPAGVQRPTDQPRGFGNDITQYIEDERKRLEDIQANRRP
jgi:hypothetical protein